MRIFTLCIVFCLLTMAAWAQEKGSITGTVTSEDGEPLIGANVFVTGTTKGTAADVNGNFSISGLVYGEYTLQISYIGYEEVTQTVSLNGASATVGTVALAEAANSLLNAVIISGSRRAEKITESPATIQIISSKDIEEIPSFNPGELLSRIKGVDFIRSGVVGTGINIRGFNSNFNAKNLQVNDGRLATLIATGLPFGPLSPLIKEDVERVEVVLGPNAVLYGPNAHNGLVHTITKDPRTSPGTTIGLGGGNQSVFSARVRHAQILNDKLSFKVLGEYTRGEEFEFADSVYIDRDGIPGTEGYEELELDNTFEFFKGNAALYYNLTDQSDLILSVNASQSTYLAPTNVGRNQINDWNVGNVHLRYTSPNWFAQVYYTWSSTDSTYAIDERTKQYYRGLDAGLTDAQARGAQSYASGALFVDESKRINAEVQFNETFGKTELVTGVQLQHDMADSRNTYLLDDSDDLNITQIGYYGQLKYNFNERWQAIGAFRADNHEIYDFNFVPKLGLLSRGKLGTWRLTYGQGIAAPTILNMFGDLFSGLILGNAQGFTILDPATGNTSQVERQSVEKIQTFEVGYKGATKDQKLFIDVNAYYNISKDFLSPVTGVGIATERGDTPIDQVQSGFGAFGGLVFTYVNFGQVNTFGTDIGLNYYFTDQLSMTFNYSFFDYSVDEDDLENNDFNGDGVVNKLDVLVNAPTNKASLGFNYRGKKVFANLFLRWVEGYDYFSSFQIAAETQDLVYRGVPVVEDARSNDTWNYGQLGDFVNVDLGVGYRFSPTFTASAQVTNLFDAEYREFTASPFIGRLFSVGLKVQIPPIGGTDGGN